MKIDSAWGHHLLVFQHDGDKAPKSVNLNECIWFKIDWDDKNMQVWHSDFAKMYRRYDQKEGVEMHPVSIKTKFGEDVSGFCLDCDAVLMGLQGLY